MGLLSAYSVLGQIMGFKVYDTGNSNGNDTKNEDQVYNSNNDGLANSKEETNSYTSFNSNDTTYELNNEAIISSNNSFKESISYSWCTSTTTS